MMALRIFSKHCATTLLLVCILMGSSAYGEKIFDHSSTGFDLLGAHSVTACENCHAGGQFAGMLRRCEGCHSRNGRVSATPKPPNHILSTDQCEECHQESSWQGVVLVDHSQVLGTCFQCHNNTIVSGQPINHISTLPNCSACHTNTLSWAPVTYVDHDFVQGPCASCHISGGPATGQPQNHSAVIPQCDGCHSNETGWLGVSMDHDYVVACYACHGPGGVARGQPQNHIPTGSTECSACHGTNWFKAPDTSVRF